MSLIEDTENTHEVTIDEALDLLFGKQEEKKDDLCPTAPHTT